MNITKYILTVLFSVLAFCSKAQVLDEQITITFKNITIKSAINKIEENTPLSFTYGDIPALNKKINATFKDVTINNVFQKVFTKNGILYKVIGNNIALSEMPKKEKYTVSGYVYDAETGEVMIGAKVYVPSEEVGAITNNFGFYSITLTDGDYEVLYSFVAKESQKKLISLDEDIELNIHFKPRGSLTIVTVVGQRKEHETTEMGTINLSMDKVKTLPVLLGERDIIKTAQLLPGIQSGSEGSSGLYVRGGGPDQNLILLDGVPIYNANHLFGFFSVFNADAINSVKLVKGGFPAQYGGRISSVIDINMIDGDMKKIHGEGSAGIISSKLMLNGPIIKDKTSFMISARRTYIDVLAKPFLNSFNGSQPGEKINGGYFFYDINAKVNHIFSSKDRLYFSTYIGKDKFSLGNKYTYNDLFSGSEKVDETKAGIKWGNKIMALRWNHKFGPKLFANTTLNYSSYSFNTGYSIKEYFTSDPNMAQGFSFDYDSGIVDWGGNMSFYYYPNPNHKVQFGFGDTYHTFIPGVNQIKNENEGSTPVTPYGSKRTYAHEFFGYIQDDFVIRKRFMMNAGIHFSNFIVREKYYATLQPRASINFKLDENSSIKAYYARTAQFLHLLTNSSLGLPTDLWVPATDSIPPQYANQYAFGYSRALIKAKGYYLSSEAYFKEIDNVIEYKEGASFFGGKADWEKLVEKGQGWSYGLEILLEKRIGKTTGWIGYTLGWANRKFENLNSGEAFPYKYDRRHDLSIVLTHKLNKKWDFGLVYVYGTGNSVTLATQQYNALEDGDSFFGNQNPKIESYESRNNYRVPSYHRLDIGVNLNKEKKWGTATWSFGIYNVYNRRNPFYLEFGTKSGDPNSKILKQISLFPILPSISYNFKF